MHRKQQRKKLGNLIKNKGLADLVSPIFISFYSCSWFAYSEPDFKQGSI